MKTTISILTLFLALSLLFTSCGPGESDDDSTVSVVATIGMIADVAGEIGGDRVAVHGLMGPGVDPHLYKASAGDVRRLQDADLILYNGLHLEAGLGEVLEQISGSRPVYAVGESVAESDLIGNESFGGSHDPHLWFDVSLWTTAVEAVAEALIAVDPEGRDTYEANLERYRGELEALDAEVRDRLAAVGDAQRVLISAHDAFGYFGRAYGFDVRGLQGISTVSEAGARDVQNLADFIAENEIGAVFVESSVPRKNIEALQAAVRDRGFDVEIGGELFSDAMGEEGTEEGTYIGMVRHNVVSIAEALGGQES